MVVSHPTGGFEHELVLHDGPAELVDLMVPFVRDGAAAGDQLIVLGEPGFVDALMATVPGDADVQVLVEPDDVRFPGRDLHRFQRLLARADGLGHRVRVVNKMPTVATSGEPEWRRYEAAVNVVLAPYRAWGACAHDCGGVDSARVRDLAALHPVVRTTRGCHRSEEFDGSGARVRDLLRTAPHPLESTPPTLTMTDPTAGRARRAVRDLAVTSELARPAQEAIIFATSEAVSNAWFHGRPPVLVRVWATGPGLGAGTGAGAATEAGAGAGALTVSVSDRGAGPHPLVGLVPAATHGLSGHGMWLVHLLLRDIHHRSTDEGYTVTFGVRGDAPPCAPGLDDL